MPIKLIQKPLSALIILLISTLPCSPQYNNSKAVEVLNKLDSIRNGSSVSKFFAAIYFETVKNAVPYFSKTDSVVQQLADRLEKRFAWYFFRSVEAHAHNTSIPDEWKAYYADNTSSRLRYVLFGINAHINGDIWQALTSEFSLQEIKLLEPAYYSYRKKLAKDYDAVYDMAFTTNSRIKLFHVMSFGLDKVYGKVLLHRWRKRQIKLAELFYTDKTLFEKKLARLHRKTVRLNNKIRRNT